MIANLTVKGAVQGVGYRPFILKKANEYGIKGFVKNIGAAVEILAIGEEAVLIAFSEMINSEYPTGAFILSVDFKELDEAAYISLLKSVEIHEDLRNSDFRIIESSQIDLSKELPVFLPDIGICDDCLSEMLSSKDRRYRYPLISCAVCGPRFSILNKLPYDRDTTTMIDFKMCPTCLSEYKNGRRHHAQTISCFDCGPQILLKYRQFTDDSIIELEKEKALNKAITLLSEGKVLGLKGVTGYQMICKPTNEAAKRLRKVKERENKPFAVMFSDIQEIKRYCFINDKEISLLESSARPIVLLEAKERFPYEVCKESRYIGAFLPSAGIHRLLCDAIGPMIVTSANISDEPIIIDDDIFKQSFFDNIKTENVDGFLYHKRRINMTLDDSVMFVTKLKNDEYIESFIRRARGFVPLPLFLNDSGHNDNNILAFGGDLKSTFSFAKKDRVITSQYIGDLKGFNNRNNLVKLIDDYRNIFSFIPNLIICDRHPMYFSVKTAEKYAKDNNIALLKVQHHHAHVLSVMAENSLKSCIGIAFDGTGFGDDEKIWGGEVFYCNGPHYDRKGHLSYVKLCGGDKASKSAKLVKECYYYALSKSSDKVSNIVKAALDNNVNTFETSSVGRLFDAVSALLEIKDENSFEGECAISIENYAWNYHEKDIINLNLKVIRDDDNNYLFDQISFFNDIDLAYRSGHYSKEAISFSFHNAIANAVVKICDNIRNETSENKVCLSGGVFSNRLLLKMTVDKLRDNGFSVYMNRFVPAGDAGISLGQAYFGMLNGTELVERI
ncbi:carbamoyltransferase HypF [Butyrivibrio sp. YAB3001]|uniref:carbamoyltransferase HypF n=1 Tax=Butyrivibrio sp. YAB3001 TaxID=1520812 RepID=UPI0008F63E77|nr:carbamoyltransferase HypF [Butyrivibrio sp. YAB3001]SFB67119.1 hydrogenase maturation protein HypF [Butyrivibrio sp. YAB3001]